MAGRLRTSGIDAAVSPDNYAAFARFAEFFGPRTFDVMVRKDQLEEARTIVDAFLKGTARSP